MTEIPMRTFSILVENRFGVLFNIAGLFSARGYNIERLTVVPDERTGLSRITMAARCGPALAEQIVKQLYKIIDVVSVDDISDVIKREESLWQISSISATQRRA